MRIYPIALLALIFIFASHQASAQQNSAQKSLGTFGVWQAFTYKENDQPVCYMVKSAKFPAPKNTKNTKFKRGATYLMITHRPGENNKDVISYIAGYNFKPATNVDMTIGKNSFDLFTSKDTAWSRDSKTDHAIAAAIRMNSSMKVSAVPAPPGPSKMTDTLDLKGSDAAYQAINKACGYEAETKPKPAVAKKKKAK